MDNQTTQSRTLVTIIGVAILVVAGLAIWFTTRTPGDDFEFSNATTTHSDTNGSMTPSGQSENITVYAPRMNERVGTPLVIQGQARVFENVVDFRLVDAQGKEIAKGSATAQSPDVGQFGTFRGELNFAADKDQQGTVEVFWYSPKDGSEIDKVIIPVTITRTPDFIKG